MLLFYNRYLSAAKLTQNKNLKTSLDASHKLWLGMDFCCLCLMVFLSHVEKIKAVMGYLL